ncbi:MAG: mechanosensitive ion channel [Phycisphaerales bacterium]|jgi:MscS family membrane protein|nr:mechanosensitive ion channel [Phycisphaerales bacterium]
MVSIAVVLAATIAAQISLAAAARWLSHRAAAGDRNLLAAIALAMRGPLMLVIWGIGLSVAIEMYLVPEEGVEGSWAVQLLEAARLLSIAAGSAWFLQRSVRAVELTLVEKGVDATAIHALGNIVIVIFWAVAALVTLQTLGVNTAAILTVGGIGGVAIGIASKDLITNVFGGLVVILTRPFGMGDRVEVMGKSMTGTVDRIGLYHTTIIDDEDKPIAIPNGMFLSVAVRRLDDG